MVAPSVAGHYRSYWRFQDASGVQFGVGSGKVTFFADINVSGSPGWQPQTSITAHTPNPSIPGQAVAVTATVSGSGYNPDRERWPLTGTGKQLHHHTLRR